MSSRGVQVSFDEALLKQVDADPEARALGRSAFIRAAVEAYLRRKRAVAVDAAIAAAYAGEASALLAEAREVMEVQAWPRR